MSQCQDNSTSSDQMSAHAEPSYQETIAAIALDPEMAKCSSRSGGLSLDKLKDCARYLSIPTTQSKSDLVEAIVEKVKKREQLADIEKEKEASRGTSFRKNKNTLPRLINLLMQYPDALQRSFCLATR